MTIKITSEEINLLVYNYLLETGKSYSGLGHTAFSMLNESGLQQYADKYPSVPPGYLASMLEKALVLVQYEAHLYEENMLSQGSEKCRSYFYLLNQHECSYRDLSAIENGAPEDDFFLLKEPDGPIGKPIWSPHDPVILTYNATGTAKLLESSVDLPETRTVASLPHVSDLDKTVAIHMCDWGQNSIATVGTDGIVRVWSPQGRILYVLNHSDQIASAHWSQTGKYLLTVGSSIAVWEGENMIQEFNMGADQVISTVGWRSDEVFAAAGSTSIVIQRLGTSCPREIPIAEVVEDLRWGGEILAWRTPNGPRVWSNSTGLQTYEHPA